MPTCVVPKCKSRPGMGKILHRFPRNSERRKIWAIKVKRLNFTPHDHSIICSDHFDESQYESHRADNKRKLRPDAVPTLFWYRKKPPKPRKPPKKRSINPEPEVISPSKTILFEHGYSTKKFELAPLMEVAPTKDANMIVPPDDTMEIVKEEWPIEDWSPSGKDNEVDEHDLDMPNECPDSPGPSGSPDESESVLKQNGSSNGRGPMTETLASKRYMSLERKFMKQKQTIARLKFALLEEQGAKKKILKEMAAMQENLKEVFTPNQLDHLGKESNKGVKRVVWLDDTIYKGLQLRFACGASGYQLLLSQGQPLPSERSLQRKLEVFCIEPGIMTEVIKMLKVKVSVLDSKERECCLTVDEMPLQPGLHYDTNLSCLRGDVTLPGHQGLASRGLVIMLGGVTTRWKQTVAYHFTRDDVDGNSLKSFILEIIKNAHDIGLHVSCITCGMGGVSQALWESFGVIVSNNERVNKVEHPHAQGRNLYFLANVPHVVQNLMGCFINGDVITLSNEIVAKFNLPSNTVSKDHVRDLAAFQANKKSKLAPKLTEDILNPGQGKLKVSQARNVFDHSVSSGIRFLVESEGRHVSYLTTAWFLEFINKWLNLMSSRHPASALSKSNVLNAYNESVAYLESVVWVFENLFIGAAQWNPVQAGVILATSSILELHVELFSLGHGYVLTSRFTETTLENLYGCLKMKHPVPSCPKFRQVMKIITIAQYLKCPTQGCYVEDDKDFLAEFLDKCVPEYNTLSDFDKYYKNLKLPSSEQPQKYSSIYLVSYCISQLQKLKGSCHGCHEALCKESEEIQGGGAATKKKKKKSTNSFKHGSDKCMEVIQAAEEVFQASEDKFTGKELMKNLLSLAEPKTKHITLSQCHNINEKLLVKYFTVRLHIYAKKEQERRYSTAASLAELVNTMLNDEESSS